MKILICIDSAYNVDVVCDCTCMRTLEDARKCLDCMYAGIISEDVLAEAAKDLVEEGEYSDGEDLTFKIINISNINSPLA